MVAAVKLALKTQTTPRREANFILLVKVKQFGGA